MTSDGGFFSPTHFFRKRSNQTLGKHFSTNKTVLLKNLHKIAKWNGEQAASNV